MTPLDSILAEVGPIFNSSQFSHPSFQEVLAARQFAEEINSGRLSVNDAYINFWSNIEPTKPKALHKDYRTVSSKWRPALSHLATMLSDVAAEEFINVISNSYFTSKKQVTFSSRGKFYDIVLEDLALCVRYIGEHSELRDRNRANQILSILTGVACSYAWRDDGEHVNIRSLVANKALRLSKSQEVAVSLMEFLQRCGSLMHDDPDTDLSMITSNNEAWETIDEIVKSGIKIPESALLELNSRYKGMDLSGRSEPVVGLMGAYGGSTSLEVLTTRLVDGEVLKHLSWGERAGLNYQSAKNACLMYFRNIFSIIMRCEFDPELIVKFNKRIVEARSGELMSVYHSALAKFAQSFKEESGIDLYGRLEKNKMQFWDYWMVYKPK